MANGLGGKTEDAFEGRLREMNEALLVSSVRQHELTEQAQRAEAALRKSEAELRSRLVELARFNRMAVGRESRMIDLKKLLNNLSIRHGETVPFPLEFEHEAAAHADPSPSQPRDAESNYILPNESIVPLESILRTEELTRRAPRRPNYETENRGLASLVQALAQSADTILQVLAEKILEVLKADSAGISLLTEDGNSFYWPAIAGVWKPHIGRGTPRNFGPCGDVLDRNTPLLYQHLERRYTYFQPVAPPVEEALLIPFYVEGKAVGTIWALSHGERRFDAEDLRQLESLGRFASAAYQAVGAREREQSRRTAALNLMEDAIDSRHAIERVNAELRVSEERYRTLFTSIDEGFCVIEMLFDQDGKPVDYLFLETNPGFEKQTGLHGAVGKRMRELAPTHEAHWFEKYGNVALTGEPVRFVNEAQDLGGRWFDVYAFRLGESGSRRVAILLTDISRRVRLENTTQEYATSLADLNRRKDEFLAMLSHELRNPLAAIANAIHLLRLQRDRNPLQIQAHEVIERQVSQLARLVDDLLEVSRISTGRIRLNVECLDLRGIVERAVEAAQSQASRKEQSLALKLPGEPVWVSGDSVRLEQIVVNLLNNAVKYTDSGGEIRVALHAEADEALLHVRDNGVGIAPAMLPRIFDLFAQEDRSLDRAQGGLGIGLTLVRSLVTMHRGRVDAMSVLGVGSEFIVRLPLLLVPHASIAHAANAAVSSVHKLKVLVVDDSVDSAQSLALLLETLGHDVRMAHDGPRGMQIALEYLPDIVLLDIGLPGFDGLHVAKWIRRQPPLKTVMLVALTGYGQESDRERSREAGFDHHLVKPVSFARIESILSVAASTAPPIH